MTIELTDQEAQAIVNLADAAVRAAGLKLAPTACEIVNKIVGAAQEAGLTVDGAEAQVVEGIGATAVATSAVTEAPVT